MSIMEKIFGAKQTQTQPPQNPAAPNITNNLQTNPPPSGTQTTAVTAPNGVVPEQPKVETPAPKFNDLWEPPKPDDKQTTQPQEGLTPEKMLEAASKVDFSKVISQDALAKIQAGGADAVTALAEILNKHGQTVYGQSIVVAQKLVESEVAKARDEFATQLPGRIKATSAREALISQNPSFNKPTVAPIVDAVQKQLQIKYPNASVDELNQMAKEFLTDAVKDLVPPQKSDTAPKAKDDVDWDAELRM